MISAPALMDGCYFRYSESKSTASP